MNIIYLKPVYALTDLPNDCEENSVAYDLTKNDSSFFVYTSGKWYPTSIGLNDLINDCVPQPGYLHPDGTPDTLSDALESGRCMAQALGFLLQENEGVVVVLPFQSKYPTDPCGKYVVFNKNNQMHVSKTRPDEEIHTFEAGQFVMVHDDPPADSMVH